MNILIIADDYLYQSTKVSAKMLHELACDFKKQNHFVTCIVANNYNEVSFEIIDEIAVYRFNSGRIKNVNKFIRLINEFQFSKKVLKIIKSNPKIKVDLVVYYSPSIFFWKSNSSYKKAFWDIKLSYFERFFSSVGY